MRMLTLLPFGEGCMGGEAIDTRTRSIRRKGHSTISTSPNPLSTLLQEFACARLPRSRSAGLMSEP
jgi:hypothetical protein